MKLVAVLLVAFTALAGADPQPSPPQQRQLAKQERRAMRQQRRARRIQKLIAKYDLNHDGVVETDELPPRLVPRLQKLDRNHDGWLDQADIDEPGLAGRGSAAGWQRGAIDEPAPPPSRQ